MSDNTTNKPDESTASLSADQSSNGEFFIDDYSHLRLSYYQDRDDFLNLRLFSDMSISDNQDSAYSTNASTTESFLDIKEDGVNTINTTNDAESARGNPTNTSKLADPKTPSNSANPTNARSENYEAAWGWLREYLVSQIPDLPHPSVTAASIISSAMHRTDPTNRFVYNNQIEQGRSTDEDVEDEIGTFAPERRSTLKPETK